MDIEVTRSDTVDFGDSTSRRRSGRVAKAPKRFTPEQSLPPSSAAAAGGGGRNKRKRGAGGANGEDEDDGGQGGRDDDGARDHDGLQNGNGAAEDDPTDDDTDDETISSATADEYVSPVPGRKRPSRARRSREPSSKRAKTRAGPKAVASAAAAAAATPTEAPPSASLPTRPKKSVRMNPEDIGEGLYADIFSSGDSSQTVVEHWHERWREDAASATAELISCVLQCAGCSHEITVDDINDPDHCDGRVSEIQLEYQEQAIAEYALVSRTKKNFRPQLIGFFKALVALAHESDILYKDQSLFENLHMWIATLSSSTLRPFRHTATTVDLAVATALVDVAVTLAHRIANIEQQVQATGKSRNRAKAAEMARNLDEANENRRICLHFIRDLFQTIFVNRYRDVESKIRVECVEGLGYWAWQLPAVFLDANHLRYLGWMLSDSSPLVRQEVLKQLGRIFKRDSQKLGHFIDRFRPRLVDMATRDQESSVRVAAIGVVESLRGAGLLEPTEIDSIGKLIFDTDPKIRKTVAPFFDACIRDVIESMTEELGGTEALDEVFEGAEPDEYQVLRREWVTIKCLAETIAAYDAQIEEDHEKEPPPPLELAAELVPARLAETRISVASQVLCERIPEVKKWELIAGYLLFDHTTSSRSKSKSGSRATDFGPVRRALAPEPAEEAVLLEVLATAIKFGIQSGEVDKSGRRGRLRAEAMDVAQEETAIELAATVPQLLNKFGANPETAIVVLKMTDLLDLNIFQQLRQDSAKYEKLLDEIITQFGRHDNRRVIAEASACLLNARMCEGLEEVTESKLAVLWETMVNTLHNFDENYQLSVRGDVGEAALAELCSIMLKISTLYSISNGTPVLEATSTSDRPDCSPAIGTLVDMVGRGRSRRGEEADMTGLEDETVTYAIRSCRFYFLWKVYSLKQSCETGTPIPEAAIKDLSGRRDLYSQNLGQIIVSRQYYDELRLFAAKGLCELHTMMANLTPWIRGDDAAPGLGELVHDMDPDLVPQLLSVFDMTERNFAKKGARKLNEPAEDEDPEEDVNMSDDEEDDAKSRDERRAAEAKAEKALCDLAGTYVLAIHAGVLDHQDESRPGSGKVTKRMQRNLNKLGQNYKEIISQLDDEKRQNLRPAGRGKKGKSSGAAATSGRADIAGPTSKRNHKSAEMVVSDDSDGDDDVLEEVESLMIASPRESLEETMEPPDDPTEDQLEVEM